MLRLGYDAKRIFHNRTGLGNYGRDLVRILAEYYPENRYFLYNPKPARVHRLQLTPAMTERRPSGLLMRRFPALWRSRGILKDLKRDGIRVFHGLSAELPAGISRTDIASVVTIHDLIFLRFPELYKPIDRWIYRQKFLRAVREADAVVAISRQTKRDIMKFGGVAAEKIRVIYQGCHPVFKEQLSGDFLQQVRRKYGLPQTFLLQVGTVEPRKNLMNVLRALRDLPYALVVVGRLTDYGHKAVKYVHDQGMENRILFLHGLELRELAALYRLARVSIYPSMFEGFGIPIIESLYAGTPVITNARGVFPEAAGPGGIYVDDVQNPGELGRKIRLAMETDISDYSRKGREYVRRFDDEVLAGQWMELYRELANK